MDSPNSTSPTTTDDAHKRRRGLLGVFRRKHPKKTEGHKSVVTTTTTTKTKTTRRPPSAHGFQSDAQTAPLPSSSPSPRPTTTTAEEKSSPSSPSPQPRRVSAVSARAAETSWLMRQRRFRRLCDAVFDAVDTDGSGSVDEKELYAGLLLIHLKFGAYAGPAACRPLDRQRCAAVFADMDADGSGELDREEFTRVIVYLFGNVLLRVAVQWSMTLLVVPLAARYILDGVYGVVDALYTAVTTMDEYFWVADQIELTLEYGWDRFVSFLPHFVVTAFRFLGRCLDTVPQSVWNSIPLTLLSTVLGIAVVPYMIFRIDEFFTQMARKNAQNKEQHSNKQKSS